MSGIVTISTASLLIPDGAAYPSPLIERAIDAVKVAGRRGSDLFGYFMFAHDLARRIGWYT